MTAGTRDEPWQLSTAPGSSNSTMSVVDDVLVRVVGSTTSQYGARAVDDPAGWLLEQGDRVLLGAVDEQKAAAEGTVEAWGRSAADPVGGRYGLRRGYRGSFGLELPPLLEAIGRPELTHDVRSNRVRAVAP